MEMDLGERASFGPQERGSVQTFHPATAGSEAANRMDNAIACKAVHESASSRCDNVNETLKSPSFDMRAPGGTTMAATSGTVEEFRQIRGEGAFSRMTSMVKTQR